MKNRILFVLLLASQIIISQNISISGKIIDAETKEPIFGVSIFIDGNNIGYSDVEGDFNFDINGNSSKISMTHLAYNSETFNIEDFLDNTTFILKPNVTTLNEVVISGTLKVNSLQEILKLTSKIYDDNYRKAPYWSGLNYKQIIYQNGQPHSYLELDGNIFMVGNDRNPFISPLIVPNEIRRTQEDFQIIRSWAPDSEKKDFYKTQLGGSEAVGGWTYYRFLELAHPLEKQGHRNFNFSFAENVNINSDYYVIRFTQKKDINLATRWIDYMHGQLWIDKKDFSLYRISANYRFERISYQSFNIQYTRIQGKYFPTIIEKNSYMFRTFKEDKSRIVITSISNLKNIDVVERKNYRYDYIAGPWYSISERYNSEYWDDKSIDNPKYSNALKDILKNRSLDAIFLEGAATKEYNSNLSKTILENLKQKGEELKKIMKNDLKNKL